MAFIFQCPLRAKIGLSMLRLTNNTNIAFANIRFFETP